MKAYLVQIVTGDTSIGNLFNTYQTAKEFKEMFESVVKDEVKPGLRVTIMPMEIYNRTTMLKEFIKLAGLV